MDNEKDLLRKDLENQNTPEEIKKFVEDAELLGHEDIALLGKQKLEAIEAKAGEISKTSESQVSQVNELGGSSAEIDKRTEEVDQKIEEVKKDTESEIKNIEETEERYKNLPEEIIKGLSTVESNFKHTQEQIDKIKEIIDSFNKQDKSNLSSVEIFNNAVRMIDNVAEILGDGNYGEGLNFIRNPESYNKINEKVILETSATSMSYPVEDHGKYTVSKNEYPQEVISLMDKKEELISQVHGLINEVVKIREEARKQVEEVKQTPEDQLMEHIGSNVFRDSIDFSKGVEVKKYDDEPGLVYFNFYLNEDKINDAKKFLEINGINDYTWISKDKIQIKISDSRPSQFK